MRKYSNEQINQWHQEYRNGSTLPRLSKKFKVSTRTIRYRFKELGFKTRSVSEGVKIGLKLMSKNAKLKMMRNQFKKRRIPKNYIYIPKEKLQKLYNSRLSSLQIAKRLKINKSTILRKFKKYNIPINEETKKRGEIKKGQSPWNKGKTNIYSKETIKKLRKARLKQVYPKKDTLPERIFEKELKSNKIKYKKHHPIHNICQPDFFIEPNITIFVDGDYWHVNPKFVAERGIKSLTKAQIKNMKRDKIQNKRLKEKGFDVYRFWERDIKEDVQSCLNSIKHL